MGKQQRLLEIIFISGSAYKGRGGPVSLTVSQHFCLFLQIALALEVCGLLLTCKAVFQVNP